MFFCGEFRAMGISLNKVKSNDFYLFRIKSKIEVFMAPDDFYGQLVAKY